MVNDTYYPTLPSAPQLKEGYINNQVNEESFEQPQVMVVHENKLQSNGPNEYSTPDGNDNNIDMKHDNNNNNGVPPNDNNIINNNNDNVSLVPNFGNQYMNLREGLRRAPEGEDYVVPNFWDFKRKVNISYILWFFLGWLGAHQIYNRRYAQCFLYWAHVWFIGNVINVPIAFAFFLLPFMIMIIIDGFRMKHYVELANSSIAIRRQNAIQMYDTYQFWYFPFGVLGFHHFYMRNYWRFFAYFFTFGIFGFGFISDAVYIKTYYYPQTVHNRKKPFWRFTGYHKKELSEMWLTWLPFAGWLGIHQMYAGDIYLGLCYTLSFGLWGVGWFIDLFRNTNYLKRYNDNIEYQVKQVKASMNLPVPVSIDDEKETPQGNNINNNNNIKEDEKLMEDVYHQVKRPQFAKTHGNAYSCWLASIGILGLHHLYLQDWLIFLIHFFSLSGCGIMWVVDLFLLPSFVEYTNARLGFKTPDEAPRVIQDMVATHKDKFTSNVKINVINNNNNDGNSNGIDQKNYHLEKMNKNKVLYIVYALWCPLWGFVGLYYLYLRQYKTFVIRFFTLNFLLIGWLIDAVRIPYLVRDYLNQPNSDQEDLLIDNNNGGNNNNNNNVNEAR